MFFDNLYDDQRYDNDALSNKNQIMFFYIQ
jgi:hypothetical protein